MVTPTRRGSLPDDDPAGTTALGLQGCLAVYGLWFVPTVANPWLGFLALAGLAGAWVATPLLLSRDASSIATATSWEPRRTLYLVLAAVPGPVGFLAVGDYLRKRRHVLAGDVENPRGDSVAAAGLRLLLPAAAAMVLLAVYLHGDSPGGDPGLVRTAAVGAAEAAFYLRYVRG